MPAIRPLPHLACLLIWIVAVLATPAQAAERTLDRTFKVEPGGRLDVAADAASIQVTGGSNNGVVVKVVLSGAQDVLDDVELSAAQQGNDVSVIAKRKTRNRGRLTGSITVQVPARYDIELKSSGGDLKVERVNGKTRGKTSGGDLIANQLQGNVEIQPRVAISPSMGCKAISLPAPPAAASSSTTWSALRAPVPPAVTSQRGAHVAPRGCRAAGATSLLK